MANTDTVHTAAASTNRYGIAYSYATVLPVKIDTDRDLAFNNDIKASRAVWDEKRCCRFLAD